MTKTERFKRLRMMPCCCGCGRPAPSDVAHSNFYKHGKSKSIKADDYFTIPLARPCHQRFDTYSMGLSRNESLEWFEHKLKYVNEVLSGKDNQTDF